MKQCTLPSVIGNAISWGGGTGKTTFITNLAYFMAQLGQKTLLIDRDVGNPQHHLLFGCSTPDEVYKQVEKSYSMDPIHTYIQEEEIDPIETVMRFPELIIPATASKLLQNYQGIDNLHFLLQGGALPSHKLNEVLHAASLYGFRVLLIDNEPGVSGFSDGVIGYNEPGDEIKYSLMHSFLLHVADPMLKERIHFGEYPKDNNVSNILIYNQIPPRLLSEYRQQIPDVLKSTPTLDDIVLLPHLEEPPFRSDLKGNLVFSGSPIFGNTEVESAFRMEVERLAAMIVKRLDNVSTVEANLERDLSNIKYHIVRRHNCLPLLAQKRKENLEEYLIRLVDKGYGVEVPYLLARMSDFLNFESILEHMYKKDLYKDAFNLLKDWEFYTEQSFDKSVFRGVIDRAINAGCVKQTYAILDDTRNNSFSEQLPFDYFERLSRKALQLHNLDTAFRVIKDSKITGFRKGMDYQAVGEICLEIAAEAAETNKYELAFNSYAYALDEARLSSEERAYHNLEELGNKAFDTNHLGISFASWQRASTLDDNRRIQIYSKIMQFAEQNTAPGLEHGWDLGHLANACLQSLENTKLLKASEESIASALGIKQREVILSWDEYSREILTKKILISEKCLLIWDEDIAKAMTKQQPSVVPLV